MGVGKPTNVHSVDFGQIDIAQIRSSLTQEINSCNDLTVLESLDRPRRSTWLGRRRRRRVAVVAVAGLGAGERERKRVLSKRCDLRKPRVLKIA